MSSTASARARIRCTTSTPPRSATYDGKRRHCICRQADDRTRDTLGLARRTGAPSRRIARLFSRGREGGAAADIARNRPLGRRSCRASSRRRLDWRRGRSISCSSPGARCRSAARRALSTMGTRDSPPYAARRRTLPRRQAHPAFQIMETCEGPAGADVRNFRTPKERPLEFERRDHLQPVIRQSW